MRDPGKGGDNVHDVDGAGPGLWASRGSGPDLQNGTDNVGGRIGYLGVDAGTTTRAQNISTRRTLSHLFLEASCKRSGNMYVQIDDTSSVDMCIYAYISIYHTHIN